MEILVIKFFNILECIFCLHRTISSSTRILRLLRYLHVLFQLCLISTHGAAHYFVAPQLLLSTDSLVFCTSTANSLALVILAIYKSKKYKEMIKYLNMNHLRLKEDPQYNKDLKIILILPLLLTLITFVLQVVALIEADHKHTPVFLGIGSYFWDIFRYLNQPMCTFRFFFEFSALYSVLSVMSEQLASLTRSVEEFEVVKKGGKPDVECKEKLKIFDKWCVTYTNVKESSKLFNNVYGLQVGITII